MLHYPLFLVMTSAMAMPYHRSAAVSIERCESGRVCTNTCYQNGERIDCVERTTFKSIIFDPSFEEILPSVHLRLIEMDTHDNMLSSDVMIRQGNLTSHGMNIRFNVPKDSTMQYFCAEWLACTLNSPT